MKLCWKPCFSGAVPQSHLRGCLPGYSPQRVSEKLFPLPVIDCWLFSLAQLSGQIHQGILCRERERPGRRYGSKGLSMTVGLCPQAESGVQARLTSPTTLHIYHLQRLLTGLPDSARTTSAICPQSRSQILSHLLSEPLGALGTTQRKSPIFTACTAHPLRLHLPLPSWSPGHPGFRAVPLHQRLVCLDHSFPESPSDGPWFSSPHSSLRLDVMFTVRFPHHPVRTTADCLAPP